MRTTMTLAVNLKCSPFEIFDQDTDEVIMLINFYMELGENANYAPEQNKSKSGKEKRIRVNDETASGGWF